MSISNKQWAAMAAIVLAGLLAGGAVLMSGHKAADDGHAEHGHAEAHADDHADASKGEQKDANKDGHKDGASKDATAPSHAPGRVRLSAAQQQAAGITVQTAGPATLQAATPFQGEIRFNDDRTSHVVPRLAGVAEAVPANLGQLVQQGQVLAVITSPALSDQRSELLTAQKRQALAATTHAREKQLWQDGISAQQDYLQAQTALQEADIAVQNATQKLAAIGATPAAGKGLNRFEVRAPFAGTVVEKHLSLGEAVQSDTSIFTISDMRSVWAEFAVAPRDLAQVRVGQRVRVSTTAFDSHAEGRIAYVGALLGEQTRTARARVTLDNPQGAWRPGLFVTVAVLGGAQTVPLAVQADAVQTVEGETVLFTVTPDGFTATPVKLGRRDGATVEVLSGLQPGARYAVGNSFVLKSELGKGSADHGH